MADAPKPTATYGELLYLWALWTLAAEHEPGAAFYVADIRAKVNERNAKFGLPEPGTTTVPTMLRTGAANGVIRELHESGTGSLQPLDRATVRGAFGSGRAVGKVKYQAAVEPEDVMPRMLQELASLVPDGSRLAMAKEFLAALGYTDDALRKVEPILRKEEK